jgi:hypothetical protein
MRPPRPEMSNTTPAPVNLPRETVAPVRIAARLGFFSVVIGLAAMVYRVVNQDGQLAYLRRTAGGMEGTVGQSDVDTVALIAFWGTIGLLVIVFLVQAILIGPLKRGVGWARWVLLGLLVPNLAGVVLASAFLTDDSGLQLTPLLLIAQVVLAVLAILAALLPASTRWFREERRARLHGPGRPQ